MHQKIDKERVADDSPTLTAGTLRGYATMLRGCSRELSRIGPPSDRLRPVQESAKKGCERYDAGAKCFADAAEIGVPIAGTAEERRFDRAIDCGFNEPGEGSRLLAEALIKGEQVKKATAPS
ncbi:hypothetical protein [Actinomadura rugatobispora]|uniref:Uncharacterized protein n=1 Tax=Actinomadura rugatobispora TaxID=1994 RepID=A0ABW0ZSM6_9ACTN|nr:hypothetical protein GCM10010200_001500 [Actinomadura rugatobispora]